jgi:hypothetical protein
MTCTKERGASGPRPQLSFSHKGRVPQTPGFPEDGKGFAGAGNKNTSKMAESSSKEMTGCIRRLQPAYACGLKSAGNSFNRMDWLCLR